VAWQRTAPPLDARPLTNQATRLRGEAKNKFELQIKFSTGMRVSSLEEYYFAEVNRFVER
jgi:hypothetical protein